VPLVLATALITIRIYNYAAVPPEELSAAREATDRIFQHAGFALQWIECRVPGDPSGAACTEQLADSGEFVLRLQNEPRAPTPRLLALGSSLVDLRVGGGVLITINPELVAMVAEQADAASSLVLGRAIAHELGHQLLGTSEHSSTGLMRALWTQTELRGDRDADWRFSPQEIMLMQRTLAKRLRAALSDDPGSLALVGQPPGD
jgi:hypothetical protein